MSGEAWEETFVEQKPSERQLKMYPAISSMRA